MSMATGPLRRWASLSLLQTVPFSLVFQMACDATLFLGVRHVVVAGFCLGLGLRREALLSRFDRHAPSSVALHFCEEEKIPE